MCCATAPTMARMRATRSGVRSPCLYSSTAAVQLRNERPRLVAPSSEDEGADLLDGEVRRRLDVRVMRCEDEGVLPAGDKTRPHAGGRPADDAQQGLLRAGVEHDLGERESGRWMPGRAVEQSSQDRARRRAQRADLLRIPERAVDPQRLCHAAHGVDGGVPRIDVGDRLSGDLHGLASDRAADA
jgi:hypothetical protein